MEVEPMIKRKILYRCFFLKLSSQNSSSKAPWYLSQVDSQVDPHGEGLWQVARLSHQTFPDALKEVKNNGMLRDTLPNQ